MAIRRLFSNIPHSLDRAKDGNLRVQGWAIKNGHATSGEQSALQTGLSVTDRFIRR
jgi:hypothetical protein